MNSSLDFVLLFVNDPAESAVFYQRFFNLNPVEQSPTFVLFAFDNGVKLGLWSRKTALPAVTAQPGASEIAFFERDVDSAYARATLLDIAIAQAPTQMDFGYTCVMLDPDGHRIRFFWPTEE